MIKASAPPRESENPYVPPGPAQLVFEQFMGINTSTTRPGVKDEQMFWCDGFFPIGPLYLRTLPGIGPALWSAPAGTSIVFFDFANIGPTPYMIAFLSNGAIWAVETETGTDMEIAPAATIVSPTRDSVGMNQYGNQYVIIVSSQDNGYFLWDGTLFYQPGTLAPIVTITNGGSGYGTPPSVAATGGAGSGATFSATVSGGIITEIVITNPGAGYLPGDVVTLNITGGGGSAGAATVLLMPFALSGTSVEIYAGRVWVSLVAVLTFSAPGSVQDFSTASGGGNFTSTDSFLRVGFSEIRQTNGFLYLIADSSVNYISGVQTSGTPPTTTFTNQNADPEVGTPYAGTVDVFNRNILFANSFGAHVSYGAAVTKISDDLDGVFSTVPDFGGFSPSAAKAIIYGKKVWILLIPIIDPISGVQVNKLFLWNGKIWFASSQDVSLAYIQHQEINSIIAAWGTDEASVYPLFQQPSTAFRKTVQSKLWTVGGYFLTKAVNRLWVLGQYIGVQNPDITVSIDNEYGVSSQVVTLTPNVIVWRTVGGLVMNWTTISGDPMTWFIAGITAFAPEAVGQQGKLVGMTFSTGVDDWILISATIQPEIVAYNG